MLGDERRVTVCGPQEESLRSGMSLEESQVPIPPLLGPHSLSPWLRSGITG